MRAFDGHNDVLSRLHHAGAGNDEFLAGGEGHLDLPGAREGHLAGGLFAVFPCSPFRGADNPFAVDYAQPPDGREALAETLAMVERLGAIEREADGAVRVVRDAAALDACLDDGALVAVLHFDPRKRLLGLLGFSAGDVQLELGQIPGGRRFAG